MEDFYRIRRLPPYVFEQVNRAKAAARNAGADISFGTTTPTFSMTDSGGFPGSGNCEFDVLSGGNGGSATWQSPGITGTASGTSLTLSPVSLGAGNMVDFQTGQSFFAIACH